MKKTDNSLLFTVIVFFIFIAVSGVLIETNIVDELLQLTMQDNETKQTNKSPHEKVYYQWYKQGEMKITATKPPEGIKFMTFRGGHNIQQTNYKIDPELIAKADRYRRELLFEDKTSYQNEAESLIASLITPETQSALMPDKHCISLSQWLNDLTATIQYDKSANQEFCKLFEKRFTSMKKMGCIKELSAFQSKVCRL